MHEKIMDHSTYLQRINYPGPLDICIEVLNALQYAHLLTVPFENLDIHFKKPIVLENTFDKIVTRRRGGFCYELNGLFFRLLKVLGFTVKMISARVYDTDKEEYSPEFDHMALLVTIDNVEYLVDVGFGEFTFAPLRLDHDQWQQDQRGAFRISPYEEDRWIVLKNTNGMELPVYAFTKNTRVITEFQDRCLYHQTDANSHFTQKRLCSLPTENGRISISGNTLKITEGENINERELQNEDEFKAGLWEFFRIVI